MAQLDRVIGRAALCQIGNIDIVLRLKEATMECTVDTAENMAIRDYYHYPQAIGESWRFSCTEAVEDAVLAGLSSFLNRGQRVYITFQPYDNSPVMQGLFILTQASYRATREGHEIQLEAISVGPVSMN